MKKWIKCSVRLNTNNKQINLTPRKRDLDLKTLNRLSSTKNVSLLLDEE